MEFNCADNKQLNIFGSQLFPCWQLSELWAVKGYNNVIFHLFLPYTTEVGGFFPESPPRTETNKGFSFMALVGVETGSVIKMISQSELGRYHYLPCQAAVVCNMLWPIYFQAIPRSRMMTWSTAPLIADHKPINIATTRCLVADDDSCFIHVRDIGSLSNLWRYGNMITSIRPTLLSTYWLLMTLLNVDLYRGGHSLGNYKTQSEGYKMTGTVCQGRCSCKIYGEKLR